MSYDHLIDENYENLTKSERKVADYVLHRGSQIIYATLTEVKEAINVGDATVIRFCQKLGFSGFSDFKIAIAKEDYTSQQENESFDYYDQIADNISAEVTATAKLINKDDLNQAIALMGQAKSIYLFGVGSSGQSADSFASILLRVGLQAKSVNDPHYQSQIASLLTKDDLVFGFSLSGRTKDTFDSLKLAKTNGAKIITITKHKNTPIGKLSDVVLRTATEDFLNGGSVTGRVSQLFICDVLTKGYEDQNQVNAVKLRERVLRAIIDKSID